MDPLIQLVAAAAIGVSIICGAVVAALRLIPHPPVPENVKALRSELSDLQLQFLDFADRYELAVTRNNAKIGKLRAKLARAESDDLEIDDDHDEDREVPPVPQSPETGKAGLWSAYNRQRGVA